MISASKIVAVSVDQELRDEFYEQAAASLKKDGQGPFPKDGCTHVLTRALIKAGLMGLKIQGGTGGLRQKLIALGFKQMVVDQRPMSGDIFITKDINKNGVPDHVGIVIAPCLNKDEFFCFDNNLLRYDRPGVPYRRNIGEGPYTPILYWLRSPVR